MKKTNTLAALVIGLTMAASAIAQSASRREYAASSAEGFTFAHLEDDYRRSQEAKRVAIEAEERCREIFDAAIDDAAHRHGIRLEPGERVAFDSAAKKGAPHGVFFAYAASAAAVSSEIAPVQSR